MKLTEYFIKHPVTTIILNSMIILLGLICFNSLSVREYPSINFPAINVVADYPNASAELVESSVTNVLEDKLAGVEGLEELKSFSSEGSTRIELSFRAGTSLDQALIAVRDGVGMARAQLPKEVRDPLVERKSQSSGLPFMVVSLESTVMDFGALTHYANLNLSNAFRSLKGVAGVQVWGQPYTFKIILDPKKLYAFGINADEVYDAIGRSNLSLPVGKFQNEVSTTLDAELKSVADYENLIIRPGNFSDIKNKQHPIFLKSVASVELKTDDSKFRVRINGNPGLCMGIDKTSDSNPLEVSDLVRKQLKVMQPGLPQGMKIKVITDQAEFIRLSIKNIQSSIIEAIIFVLGIVFLFLRNIRATLIPLITIPISLIGSFLFLQAFGYSINIMTLLAMVLAVGLVVDDAIIILENITRHIENGMSALEAAIKGSREIGFAIVAMTLTLTSVYAPIAFINGVVGQLFVEFAVALAGSVLISGVVALTLSPLMCAKTLSDKHEKNLWPQVDVFLDKVIGAYSKILVSIISYKKTVLVVALILLAITAAFFKILPREIAPKEDRGLIGVYVPPIPGKDINTQEEKTIEVENLVKSIPEADGRLVFVGYWGGQVVLPLKPISERKRSASDIVASITPQMMSLPSIDAWPWSLDTGLPGVDDSVAGGDLELILSTVESYRNLLEHADKLRNVLEEDKFFESVRHDLKLDTMGYTIDLDLNAISTLNITQHQIARTIEIFFSGDQTLPFQKDGFLYHITLEGEKSPWTLDELYLTNSDGKHISLGTVAKMMPKAQPKDLFHYNQMRSTSIKAELKKGEKMETGMPILWKASNKVLPSTYKKTWAGAAKLYNESSNTMLFLFALALIFIYAILSLQFQNFIDPLIILFTVPLACAGALLFAWIFGQTLNIYTQVGLITLIGLITKHGILIIEFANQLRRDGLSLLDSILKSASLRLRPILMTTGAMIFGAIPLVLSHDAGSESRRAIGVVLLGGLSLGTLFTLFILPTLYYMVKTFRTGNKLA